MLGCDADTPVSRLRSESPDWHADSQPHCHARTHADSYRYVQRDTHIYPHLDPDVHADRYANVYVLAN